MADEPRILSPERIEELRAAGRESDAERARQQAVCVHPGDKRATFSWGVICDVCKARVA